MSFINTNKTGQGTAYWPLSDDGGRQVVRNQWTTIESEIEETANDQSKDFTVPTGEWWHIRHVYVDYTADNTVGDRRILLEVVDGSSNTLLSIGLTENFSASENLKLIFANGMSDAAVANGQAKISIPDLILPEGYILRLRESLAADVDDDMSVYVLHDTMSLE